MLHLNDMKNGNKRDVGKMRHGGLQATSRFTGRFTGETSTKHSKLYQMHLAGCTFHYWYGAQATGHHLTSRWKNDRVAKKVFSL